MRLQGVKIKNLSKKLVELSPNKLPHKVNNLIGIITEN